MTERKPLVVGNWKMNLSYKGSLALARSLRSLLAEAKVSPEVIICPSYPALPALAEVFGPTKFPSLGAQDVDVEEKGDFTGQVSVTQIADFATWCIVGHSERRALLLHENDAVVVRKAQLLLQHGISPLLCIGETREEKMADQTISKITEQIHVILEGLPRTSLFKTVICYEPIWAIGEASQGEMPDPDSVAEVVLLIRKILAERFDAQLSERVRILYGGSVKPENVAQYVGGPYADGVLVGGASLHAGKFVDIVKQVDNRF